jgi:hypothetical protein
MLARGQAVHNCITRRKARGFGPDFALREKLLSRFLKAGKPLLERSYGGPKIIRTRPQSSGEDRICGVRGSEHLRALLLGGNVAFGKDD